MCPLRWRGGQKQQASHNRLAISCHLATMQTVLELVPLSTQPNNKGMMMNKFQRTPLKMYNNKVNKCTTNSYIYIYTHITKSKNIWDELRKYNICPAYFVLLDRVESEQTREREEKYVPSSAWYI
jgi:hypothetical protein